MRRLDIFKHKSILFLNFLDSLDDKWEHHVDVLKNGEKIKTMDPQSLYVNLCKFEETKILHKEIMKDSFKEKSFVLFSKKSRFIP